MNPILSNVVSVLSTTPDRWLSLVKTLPPELLNIPPAVGEWSAVQCLAHLVDTERFVFPRRVQHFMANEDFPAFNPDSQGGAKDSQQHPLELANLFLRLRQQSLNELSQLTDEDLGRQARHQELGLVTLGEMLHEWAAHDLMHTVQAERALMQPFIRDCGPWRPYFRDHIA